MSDFEKYRAAGVRVFDGKTLNKCPDCDFTTTSFHEYTQHVVDKHPPHFLGCSDIGPVEPMDPVLERCVERCVRSLFTFDLREMSAAMRDYAQARKEKN